MGEYKKLWWLLLAVLAVTFGILAWSGVEVYRQVPPIPAQVVTPSNKVLMTKDQILDGQTAWQSTGGMQVGSIWGHGAYQAPDWSADWLHRELLAWLDLAAQETANTPFAQLNADQQATLKSQLKAEYRRNTLDPQTGVVTVSERRAQAMAQTAQYYVKLYGSDPEMRTTRSHFAMMEDTLPDLQRRQDLTKFYFWLSWAASTERPNSKVTYTNNWPHEPLVDNHPSTANVMWSVASVVILLAGIAFLVWGWAFLHRDHPEPVAPEKDPLTIGALTPSQRALGKYLFLVVALFIAQVLLGGLTAHYTVEGQTFYGINISEWLPYSLARTWHLQTALFWIASGFLAAGLFLAPVVNGGKDPNTRNSGSTSCSGRWWCWLSALTSATSWPSSTSCRPTSISGWAIKAMNTSSWAASGKSSNSSAWLSGCC